MSEERIQQDETPVLSETDSLTQTIESFKPRFAHRLQEQIIFLRLRNQSDCPTEVVLVKEERYLPEGSPKSLGINKDGNWTDGTKELENQDMFSVLAHLACLTNAEMITHYGKYLTVLGMGSFGVHGTLNEFEEGFLAKRYSYVKQNEKQLLLDLRRLVTTAYLAK